MSDLQTLIIVSEEASFRDWYATHAKRLGLNPDPYDPISGYDYRSAWMAGVEPTHDGQWSSLFRRE